MNTRFPKLVMIVSMIAVIGMAGTSFAYRGWGGDGDGCGRGGYGRQYRGDGDGPCWSDNLTEEQRTQMNTEREAFFAATRDLRQDIHSKELALRSELAKKSPDTEAAAGLQKELSKLQSAFDQKRLAHQIKMKEINPDGAGSGYFGGGRGGRGWKGANCRY